MAQSPLLTLARESIVEVLKAENSINREALLKEFPILNEMILSQVAIYVNDELFSFSLSLKKDKTLLESIIFHAKSAAFFTKNILTSAIYLHSVIELSIITLDDNVRAFDADEFLQYLNSDLHGVILLHNSEAKIEEINIPSHINEKNVDDYLSNLNEELNVKFYKIYTLEKAKDSAIIKNIVQQENEARELI